MADRQSKQRNSAMDEMACYKQLTFPEKRSSFEGHPPFKMKSVDAKLYWAALYQPLTSRNREDCEESMTVDFRNIDLA
jgi:hypothetical protein